MLYYCLFSLLTILVLFSPSYGIGSSLTEEQAREIIERAYDYPVFSTSGVDSDIFDGGQEALSFLINNGYISPDSIITDGSVIFYPLTEKGRRMFGPKGNVYQTNTMIKVDDFLTSTSRLKKVEELLVDSKTGKAEARIIIEMQWTELFNELCVKRKMCPDVFQKEPKSTTERKETVRLKKWDNRWEVEK